MRWSWPALKPKCRDSERHLCPSNYSSDSVKCPITKLQFAANKLRQSTSCSIPKGSCWTTTEIRNSTPLAASMTFPNQLQSNAGVSPQRRINNFFSQIKMWNVAHYSRVSKTKQYSTACKKNLLLLSSSLGRKQRGLLLDQHTCDSRKFAF